MRAFAVLPALGALVAAVLFCAPCRAGSIEAFRWTSAALARGEVAQVYRPSGEAPDEGWPVLYLLHGLHGGRTDWAELGEIGRTLDRLIAEKRIQPLLVVMPDGGDSWYVDSAAVGGPGDYASAIGRDLPVAIEAGFPAATGRAQRAIAGVSMGGYGALRLAFAAPERYAAVAALSPAIWQNIPGEGAGPRERPRAEPPYFQRLDPATVTIGVDLPPPGDHFGKAFGSPFDPVRFNAANVFTLLERAVEARKPLPPTFVSVGDDDSHRLWRGSIALFETMQMNRLDLDFRVTDGDHNWTLWKRSIVDALVFVSARLGRPAVR